MHTRTLTWNYRLIFCLGLAYSLLVLFRLCGVNGFPAYSSWEWPWRNLGNWNTVRALGPPFVLLLCAIWRAGRGLGTGWVLALLVCANFALQLLGTVADGRGLKLVGDIVASDATTGYYVDARNIGKPLEWLAGFHAVDLSGHGSTHPPGPILFCYFFLRTFGPVACGCAIGLLGSLGVALMYRFAGLWTSERMPRLYACAFYALSPALTVFFPEFDQTYPLLSMALIVLWARALEGSPRAAAAFGAVLFAATLFAYNLLAIGAFPLYYALYRRRRVMVSAAIALGVAAALHLLLWMATGYNAPASFLHALANQALISQHLDRPYFRCLVFDTLDFALGVGVIAIPLALLRRDAMTWIALGALVTVNLTGLLRGETSRVWLFLQPLVIAPAAVGITSAGWRYAFLTLQWWTLVCLKAKMTFIAP